jgi:cytochrome bd-type quinol oxidase subunit 1
MQVTFDFIQWFAGVQFFYLNNIFQNDAVTYIFLIWILTICVWTSDESGRQPTTEDTLFAKMLRLLPEVNEVK